MRTITLAAVSLVIGLTALHATPLCAVDTLDNYVALGAGGCKLGPLIVKGFAFSQTGTGSIPVAESDITVTPTSIDSFHYSLNFFSSLFEASGTDYLHYEIDYTWDPGDVRTLDDLLGDPTVAPGLAKLTTKACEDAAYAGTFCGGVEHTLVVYDDGIFPVISDSASFFPDLTPDTIGIRNLIAIDANGASAMYLDHSFTQIVTLAPEPSTIFSTPVVLSLAACGVLRRRYRVHGILSNPTLGLKFRQR